MDVSYERSTPVRECFGPSLARPSGKGIREGGWVLAAGAHNRTRTPESGDDETMASDDPSPSAVSSNGTWLRVSSFMTQSKVVAHIFKTVSQELCHVAADVRRPCEGARRCQALSVRERRR